MKQCPMSIEMIPIDQINALNPRVWNPKLFDTIVQNLAKVGLNGTAKMDS